MSAKHPGSKHYVNKWCPREKRLALYMRDGFACCYCGSSVEDGILLTLDHLTPKCHGGTDFSINLVTACHKCNSVRRERKWTEFAASVASYLNNGITAQDIIAHIEECTMERALDIPAARALIALRGSYANVLNNGGK